MNVRIRMYNVGFGDCFLLTFPAPDRPRKVLIDCGKHTLSRTGPKLSRVAEQLFKDIQEAAGPRVDVVVATHRHQDHVSGFAGKGWQNVAVGEVWMPWSEDPNDQTARDICDRQSRKAAHIQLGLNGLALDLAESEYLLGYAGNSLTNALAMKLLHEGFQGSPLRRFLPDAKEEKNRFRTDHLPGLEVFVLGPTRNMETMREMDPPENESFLRAWQMGLRTMQDRPAPFDRRWSLTRKEYEERTDRSLDDDMPLAWESHFAEVLDDPALELLAKLEEAVNATSLVLLFHIGDAWLLFPGDAQWGTWNAILKHPVHAKLLEALTFYKVGHHGSHNATPISFVERYVTDKVRAMIPVGTVEKWPSIPRAGLLRRLAEKNVAFARSDQTPASSAPFAASFDNDDILFIDTEIPL